ncbi:TetR/AcrR family transcriptional regulator [Bacillus sp. 03113]|uniref:TetR/AcrR family transcriptional regulator n=1 Tax=Bacillus sp. 03113 TaxID=2578211 RepID=UPI001143753D|nr:TetR/AcrR family transcriptional regulator [Bacillus sp. 03113]
MGIKERKQREREERRELILKAAHEIMKEEGIDNLSIRKIANKIEYSPAIIYHYFQDKDEIIHEIMKRGYQNIIDTLSSLQSFDGEPEEKLKEGLLRYIELALQMPDEYQTILLNSSPGILEHTSVLFEGASNQRAAIGMLCQSLKEIYSKHTIEDSSIELTAQIIWAATFGLIIRLIIEKDISREQRRNLIERHIKVMVDRVVLGKC